MYSLGLLSQSPTYSEREVFRLSFGEGNSRYSRNFNHYRKLEEKVSLGAPKSFFLFPVPLVVCSSFQPIRFISRRQKSPGSFQFVAFSSNGDDQSEPKIDLEMEVFEFMRTTGKLDAFPTKKVLVDAGRIDLVKAILVEGGWLSIGWEKEEDPIELIEELKITAAKEKEEESFWGNPSTIISDTFQQLFGKPPVTEDQSNLGKSGKSEKSAVQSSDSINKGKTEMPEEMQEEMTKKSKNEAKMETAEESTIEEVSTSGQNSPYRPTRSKNAFGKVINFSFNRPNRKTQDELPLSDGGVENNPPTRKKRRRRRRKNRKPFQQANELAEGKLEQDVTQLSVQRTEDTSSTPETSPSEEKPELVTLDEQQPVKSPPGALSTINRIRALEMSLLATKSAIKTSRESLLNTEEDSRKTREDTVNELVEVTDSLEFREGEIIKTRQQIRKARAEVWASEGRLASEFREARRVLETNMNFQEACSVPLRSTRIVWPNPGLEVFLTGSFDNWKSQVRMEKSNAGVFVANLQLPRGQYEVKFIVDGQWRIDPNRRIVYSGGNENNLLTIF